MRLLPLLAWFLAPLLWAAEWPVTPPSAELRLDPFYKKQVRVGSFPIVSSERVSDSALREAAWIISRMLQHRPDILQAMVSNRAHFVVMGYQEFTTQIPEHSHLRPQAYWDKRARGLGSSRDNPVASCGEENLLCFPGDPYRQENILIHEFAHQVHLQGMVRLDPTFDRRLKAAFDAAMKQGLWAGKYAAQNHHEYWAEGVQSFFDTNRPPDSDHNHVRTREALAEYDPGLYALVREVFGEVAWRYRRPWEREERDHLSGVDPATLPRFVWPREITEKWEALPEKKPGPSAPRTRAVSLDE